MMNPESKIALGSARASRAVRRALAPNVDAEAHADRNQFSSSDANDEGVVGNTRGACAPHFK